MEIMEKREKQTIKTKAINQAWIRKNLSKSDDNVYRYLLFAQGGNDHCWSSIKCICEKTNYSKQSVISSLKKLVVIGLIEKMKSPKKSRGHGYKVKKLDLLKIEDLDKGKEDFALKVKKTLPPRSSKLHPEGKEYFTYEGQFYLMNEQQIQWFEKFLSKTKLLKENTKGNHQIETTKDIIINCLVGDLSEAENQPACPPSVDEVPQLAPLVSEPHKSEPTVPLKDEIKKMNDHLKADIERYYKEKKKAVVEEDPVFDGLDTPYTRPEVPPERKEYKNYYNA